MATGDKKEKKAKAQAEGTPEKAVVSETVSRIDKSVRKGLIHRNTAARLKSRLMTRANAKA